MHEAYGKFIFEMILRLIRTKSAFAAHAVPLPHDSEYARATCGETE